MKFFSVKLMNIAEDRAVEVSFTITLLIAKNRFRKRWNTFLVD